ncbi:fusaric acid resistance family protein [Hasllibacter halocynthiae]|uniref:Fusaric acid resistance family protein n=1 Tax=Hasllibacter halocynthiae TaxID=595589 RepID=A0A2T0X9Z2_9RHOB|nr:FUSC family protein [Hasllibacter halocynthiae]PRY95756.1 fusaric acid resistance family protein [Hasllibacter halocynthiae]
MPTRPSLHELRHLSFDPDLLAFEEAGRIMLVTVLTYGVVISLSWATGLPRDGAWISLTVAQYAAWFVLVPDRKRRLRTGGGALAAGSAGAMAGIFLAGEPALLMPLAAVLTAAAFALGRRSPDLLTATLAFPYAMIFASYYGPEPSQWAWYAACLGIGAAIYLLVRFLLWGRDRSNRLATLVRVHRGELNRLTRRTRAGAGADPAGAGSNAALRRMLAKSVPIERRLGRLDHDLGDALGQQRVIAVANALGTQNLLPQAGAGTAAQGAVDRIVAREGDAPVPLASEGGGGGGPSPWVVLACLVVVLPIAFWTSPDRWAWGYLTAVIVFYGTQGGDDTLAKGWTRFRGTLLGAAAGVVAAMMLDGHPAIEFVAILALQFFAIWLQSLNYGLMVGLYTAFLALFFGATGETALPPIEMRLLETLVGATAGMLAARAASHSDPKRTERSKIADLLGALAETLRGGALEPAPAGILLDLEKQIDPVRNRVVSILRGRRRGDLVRPLREAGLLTHLVEVAALAGRREGAIADRMDGLARDLREDRPKPAREVSWHGSHDDLSRGIMDALDDLAKSLRNQPGHAAPGRSRAGTGQAVAPLRASGLSPRAKGTLAGSRNERGQR